MNGRITIGKALKVDLISPEFLFMNICVSSGRSMDKQDLKRIFEEVEKENELFANMTPFSGFV